MRSYIRIRICIHCDASTVIQYPFVHNTSAITQTTAKLNKKDPQKTNDNIDFIPIRNCSNGKYLFLINCFCYRRCFFSLIHTRGSPILLFILIFNSSLLTTMIKLLLFRRSSDLEGSHPDQTRAGLHPQAGRAAHTQSLIIRNLSLISPKYQI
jgi:hypothetical protein